LLADDQRDEPLNEGSLTTFSQFIFWGFAIFFPKNQTLSAREVSLNEKFYVAT
jgi:hypothetical protein